MNSNLTSYMAKCVCNILTFLIFIHHYHFWFCSFAYTAFKQDWSKHFYNTYIQYLTYRFFGVFFTMQHRHKLQQTQSMAMKQSHMVKTIKINNVSVTKMAWTAYHRYKHHNGFTSLIHVYPNSFIPIYQTSITNHVEFINLNLSL